MRLICQLRRQVGSTICLNLSQLEQEINMCHVPRATRATSSLARWACTKQAKNEPGRQICKW